MIAVRFMGQLGNQLCQYAIGRILSVRTGQAYCPPSQWLDKRGRPVKWTLDPPLFMPQFAFGSRPKGTCQVVSVNHWFDMDSIDPNLPIHVMHGYFQRYELFKPYKDQIRNDWLRLSHPPVETDPEAVYVHVRRTDYVPHVDNPNDPTRHCLSSSINDYAKCLEHFPDAKRLVIVTDDPKDPFHREFDKFGLPWTVSGQAWDADFLTLASCRWLVICQSTFSWWAGFLGQAEKIVCPVPPGTFWHYGIGLTGPAAPDYPNLYVDDEPERWTWTQ